MKKIVLLAIGLTTGAAACGDDNKTTPDASPVQPDAPPDAPTVHPFVPPTPVPIVLSPGGTDNLLGATTGPNGTFYAVGFRSPSFEPTSDREIVVVKLTAAGALDATFGGGDGIASVNVSVGGGNGETARGIAVQPGGKILALGTIEHDLTATGPAALDRDAVVVRFDATGALDTSFGVAGIARLDLGTGLVNGTQLVGADAPWGLALDATGRIYVHAAQRAPGTTGGGGPRTDTDFAVVRLTTDGAIDPTFATQGKFLLDIQESSASVRGLSVLADGSIMAGGYANSSGVGSTQPVVFKLTPAGVLDPSFAGGGGVFHEVVLAVQTEVYAFAVHGDKLVTAGYGRQSGDTNDWISLRLTAAGALDPTWGNQGKVQIDPSMMMLADNCRNAIALPGGRTMLLGNAGPPNTTGDAAFAILTATGAPDTAFGTGINKLDLGGGDAFWSGAVSSDGTRALIVGFKGAGATPSAALNDDSYAAILPMP